MKDSLVLGGFKIRSSTGDDMGILDRAKSLLGTTKDKAADLAHDHGDKIDGAIDKAGDLVDKQTKGKYADKIDGAQAKAKDAVDKLGGADSGEVDTSEEGPAA
jgi:hypothetical protein